MELHEQAGMVEIQQSRKAAELAPGQHSGGGLALPRVRDCVASTAALTYTPTAAAPGPERRSLPTG